MDIPNTAITIITNVLVFMNKQDAIIQLYSKFEDMWTVSSSLLSSPVDVLLSLWLLFLPLWHNEGVHNVCKSLSTFVCTCANKSTGICIRISIYESIYTSTYTNVPMLVCM